MSMDRGMKKWTAMMLPAHTSRLNDWDNELQREKAPEKLTEWLLAELQQTIETAYMQSRALSLIIFESNQLYTMTGIIRKIDLPKERLLLEINEGNQWVSFSSIQRADLDD